ncbi:ArsR/SmtB family transcription factor [Zavarzinia sp.]|uniref:ArsR/SmtB family transcription factor n=1 Tax=Zavarzinia sp. TaxID=2027920 RepID=UPI0035677358
MTGEGLTSLADEAAEFLKILANSNRLMIVCHLLHGERSVAELEADLAIRQPTLSQQLGILREAGIVTSRRDAKSVIYQLADDRARPLIDVMNQLFCAVPEGRPAPPPPPAPLPGGETWRKAGGGPRPLGEAAAFPTVRRRPRRGV